MASKKADVESFVSQQVLALVGVSRKPEKFSNATMKELRASGYKVYPINRNGGEAEGEKLYTSLKDLPEKPGGVLIMVKAADSEAVVREAAAAGITHVWIQQGAVSPAALKAAGELGLKTVSGECILMFASQNKFHGIHRWFNKVFGILPR
jgi:predicted CoA-binding protein